jgi:hypothetical protein
MVSRVPAAPFAGCQYKTTLTTTTDETNTTWTDVDIGTPHPHRIVILGIFMGVNVGSAPSGTVNGIGRALGRAQNEWAFNVHLVPNDTLATIIVSVATSLRKAVSVWIGYPENPIPLDSGLATANTTTNANIADLKVQAGGFLIYAGGQLSTLGTFTTTWGGAETVIEDVDAQLESASSYTAGHFNVTESTDVNDLNLAESTSGTKRLVAATWGPPHNWVA